jgi:hypothetical protein
MHWFVAQHRRDDTFIVIYLLLLLLYIEDDGEPCDLIRCMIWRRWLILVRILTSHRGHVRRRAPGITCSWRGCSCIASIHGSRWKVNRKGHASGPATGRWVGVTVWVESDSHAFPSLLLTEGNDNGVVSSWQWSARWNASKGNMGDNIIRFEISRCKVTKSLQIGYQ